MGPSFHTGHLSRGRARVTPRRGTSRRGQSRVPPALFIQLQQQPRGAHSASLQIHTHSSTLVSRPLTPSTPPPARRSNGERGGGHPLRLPRRLRIRRRHLRLSGTNPFSRSPHPHRIPSLGGAGLSDRQGALMTTVVPRFEWVPLFAFLHCGRLQFMCSSVIDASASLFRLLISVTKRESGWMYCCAVLFGPPRLVHY